jgi:tetratricopeptide (TPR) repeat protein
MGVGQWEAARGDLERALEIHQPMGDLRHAGDCLALLAHIEAYQGRSRRGLEFVDQIVAANVEYENPTQEVWSRYQQGVAALRLGRLEEALLPLEEAMNLAERYGEETAILYLQGLRAQVYWRLGRCDAALADARRAMQLIAATGGRPSSYSALDGYMGPAEVFLGMLEAWQDLGSAQRERLDKEARQACKYLHTYRRFFPIGRPGAWIYQGLLDWRGGRKARAQQAWGRALEAAQELGMPFEEARARYELGRHLPAQDPERQAHLGCACELFAQIDAAYELKLAKGAFAG